MMEVPKAGIKSDAFAMPNIMRNQGETDIGIDAALRGVSPDASRTATEHQRVQKNANLRMLLGSKIDSRAEKKFWRQWYRSYYDNFSMEDEKNIYLNTGLGQLPLKVMKKDFTTKGDIDIKVITTTEADEMQEKQRAAYMATITPILQNPGSKYSKDFALRKMYKLNGISDEEAYILVPESPEEIQAKMDLELLNRGKDPGKIVNLQEDHMTFIAIYQSAVNIPNNNAKSNAIARRRMAVRQSGQQAQQAQQEPSSELNNMSSQMTSNFIQKSNS